MSSRKPVAAFAGGRTAAKAAPVEPPKPPEQPERKWRLASTRTGKRSVTFYVNDDAYEQIQILSIKRRQTVNDMMREAIDRVFEENGLPRLAVETV